MGLNYIDISRILDEVMGISEEVQIERIRQEEKFPSQVLRYRSWDSSDHEEKANELKRWNDSSGPRLAWDSVLREELHEAFAETDLVKMREELIQTAAVVFRIVAQIDRELNGA